MSHPLVQLYLCDFRSSAALRSFNSFSNDLTNFFLMNIGWFISHSDERAPSDARLTNTHSSIMFSYIFCLTSSCVLGFPSTQIFFPGS